MELNESEAIARIFLSLFLSTIIGLEREFNHQSAGLRTHILVCMGATMFTLISLSTVAVSLPHGTIIPGVQYTISRDPGRIAAQIVSGIGFIGGGAVLRHGASVRGLTTAASLWMVASIGMLAGFGHYRLSLIGTLLAFLVLFTIGKLERLFFHKELKTFNRLRITADVSVSQQFELQHWVEKKFGKDVLNLKTTTKEADSEIHLIYIIGMKGAALDLNDLSRNLNNLPGVLGTSVKIYLEETAN
jgi:putative Mg2+ transporter-C (MgtC) family protein